jgi:hypothetical protein
VDKEVAALLLTVVVHVLGMGALVWALVLDDDNRPDWRGWFGGDDDLPPDPSPPPSPSGDGLPLPDARPSTVRLRDAGRLGDVHRRPARRPEHTPERTPAPEREPSR